MNSIPAIILAVSVLWTIGESVLTYPYVQTTSGTVRGSTVKALDREVHSYLGIPFGTPPVGNLRFRKPQPIQPWEGIYEASKKPLSCYQHRIAPVAWNVPNDEVSEDCLYLNVWTPKKQHLDTAKKHQAGASLKPVLVWIYGGGFYSGSISVDMYDGSVLAAYGDVVVASMNYRLGVFGFFSGKIEEAPGNMGMLDQVLALQWIKQNAEAFGGDPSRITIFGESAGSVSVGFHVLSPMSSGLFSRAIMQSGGPYHGAFGEANDAVESFKASSYAKDVGCATEEKTLATHPQEVVACLRNKDPLELAQAENLMVPKYQVGFIPRIGDEFLPTNPIDILKSGKVNQTEVLIGINSNEGSIFTYFPLSQVTDMKKEPNWSIEEGKAFIRLVFKDIINPSPDVLAEQYTKGLKDGDFEEIRQAVFNSIGDYLVSCSSELFADELSKVKNITVYYYYFDHYPSVSVWKEWMSMAHFEDVQFVFGLPLISSGYTKEDVTLSKYVMDRWISFSKTGVPLEPENGSWPKYNPEKRPYLQLKPNAYIVGSQPRQGMCNFWKEIFV